MAHLMDVIRAVRNIRSERISRREEGRGSPEGQVEVQKFLRDHERSCGASPGPTGMTYVRPRLHPREGRDPRW